LGRRSRRREGGASAPPAGPRRARRASLPSGREPTGAPATPQERSRNEARAAEIRAKLEPLAPGERPGAVTVAAIVAAGLALANLVAYLAGLEVDGERPAATGVIVYEALLLAAAAGMWRARYWAVLGFEFMLGFLLVFLAIFLTRASSLAGVALVLAIGVPAAILFWKLVRAMARIQMPSSPGARE
jgi:hypothetical protein